MPQEHATTPASTAADRLGTARSKRQAFLRAARALHEAQEDLDAFRRRHPDVDPTGDDERAATYRRLLEARDEADAWRAAALRRWEVTASQRGRPGER